MRSALTTSLSDDGIEFAESVQFSNHLYRFVRKASFLVPILEESAFPPRYTVEDYSYLGFNGGDRFTIAMVCFCDIPQQRLRKHASSDGYGEYGIMLRKKWGIRNHVQPVHYINRYSYFAIEFAEVFGMALADRRQDDAHYNALKSNLINQLVFFKPLYDRESELSGTYVCREDECEWRYVPTKIEGGYQILYPYALAQYDRDAHNDVIRRNGFGVLKFDDEDVVSLVVANEEAKSELVEAIQSSKRLSEERKHMFAAMTHLIGEDHD